MIVSVIYYDERAGVLGIGQEQDITTNDGGAVRNRGNAMAYIKEEIENNYSYKDFEEVIKRIEFTFHKKAAKVTEGRTMWCLVEPFISDLDGFVKTTVSDYKAVYGDVKIDVLTELSDDIANFYYISIREPQAKDFRGKIRYVPKNTLSMTTVFWGVDKDGSAQGAMVSAHKTPIWQDESYVNLTCDALFARDAKNEEYVEVCENAWKFLECDKRFSVHKPCRLPIGAKDISRNIQTALMLNDGLLSEYGVVYQYNDNVFIFPMSKERMKQIFKGRDPINGRRRTLPTLVREHQRNGTVVKKHIRLAEDYFTINGREYCFYMGSCDMDALFNSPTRIKELKNAVHDDMFYYTERMARR